MILINLKPVPFSSVCLFVLATRNRKLVQTRSGRELLLECREIFWGCGKSRRIGVQELRQLWRGPGCCLCLPSVSVSFSLSSQFLPLFAFLSLLVLCLLLSFCLLGPIHSLLAFCLFSLMVSLSLCAHFLFSFLSRPTSSESFPL